MYYISHDIRAKYFGAQRRAEQIEYIAVHYTGNGGMTATAKGNANYFANCPRKASAHFVIDEREIIYCCVDPLYAAYAVGENNKYTNGGASMKGKITNANSISIEMVSHSTPKGEYFIPQETMERTAELIRELQYRFNIPITNIYRHYDVTGKLCPAPLIKQNEWNEFKQLITDGDEMITTTKVLVNGEVKEVKRIMKDGENYIRLRDFEDVLGVCDVDYDAERKLPIIQQVV